MTETLFALFMLGCSHQLDVCRPIGVPLVRYETDAECQMAMDEMMRIDAGFPVTVGKCVQADVASFERDMVFAWHFEADGRLDVNLQPLGDGIDGAAFDVADAAQ